MSDKTCLEKIEEDFNKFNLSPEQIPTYKNARQFSQSFKICSIVEYKSISYSNTTIKNKKTLPQK